MKTLTYAEKELEILTKTVEEPIIADFIPEILALVKKFGESGQSGSSAPYIANAISQTIKKLCLQQPLCPITGIDEEWRHNEFKDGVSQNMRCSAIFKDGDRAYYLDAIVWQGPEDWDSFTGTICGIKSRQYIKSFPFKPKTFRVDLLREQWDDTKHNEEEWHRVECGPGPMAYKIKEQKQIDEVFEYYDRFD